MKQRFTTKSNELISDLHLTKKFTSSFVKPFLIDGVPLPTCSSKDLDVIVNDTQSPSAHIATRSHANGQRPRRHASSLSVVNLTSTVQVQYLSRTLLLRPPLAMLGLFICLFVCLSVSPSVCLKPKFVHKNAIFSKTKQVRAMVSIEDL